MHIAKRNAEQIVKEISGVIGESVNMMNADGIIIASTDESRVGTFHEAAKKLVDERLSELIVHGDSDYVGARGGTNLPVMIGGEIVGVVGVTGPYTQVVKYGQIIKKMTEILLLDHSYHERKEFEENIRSRFVEEWICTESKTVTSTFAGRGLALGIDITLARRIMVMSTAHSDEQDLAVTQKSFDEAGKIIANILLEDKNNIVFKTTNSIICAVTAITDKAALQLAMRVKAEVERTGQLKLAIGIDSPALNYTFIHGAYLRATKALHACLRTAEKEIRFYDNINMEIFASEIPDMVKNEYIHKIFKGCSNDEIAQWVTILETYYKEEGSITATADKLFIHKNTLQYKLRKLKEQTGYDPRSIHYSSLFYNAIYFYRDIRSSIAIFG
ncbi:MAG: sugar diacid recognition domain-containing protein [Oscillospiraceae bacterium]